MGSLPNNPKWRNVIRKREVPWLNEHQIEGRVIFPAAGYISMAIEAAVRLPGKERNNIKDIHLRDVVGMAPLALTDAESGNEVFLELRPSFISSKGISKDWYEFELFSYD